MPVIDRTPVYLLSSRHR